jgi:hypothetical protein
MVIVLLLLQKKHIKNFKTEFVELQFDQIRFQSKSNGNWMLGTVMALSVSQGAGMVTLGIYPGLMG